MENLTSYLKKAWPYIAAVLSFVVISYIYFSPVITGKTIRQMDFEHSKGMSKELTDYHEETGEYSQWTNSMFGGMPAYQIHSGQSNSVYVQIQRFLRFGLPYTTVSILFIYLLGFYLLLLSLKFNNLQSVLGALAFGLASYNIIIIAVGHITKTYAIAYMAPVMAGIIMTYKGKYFWGGLLTTFALGVEISTNHPQILYYLMWMAIIYGIVEFVYAIMQKALKKFAIASGVMVVAAVFALLPNITNLATTYEYGKESIRGPSELTKNQKDDTGGTDREYAYAWSYGVGETWTLMIPNFKGGVSSPIGFEDEKLLKDVDPNFVEYVGKSSAYFGNQTFTSGPVYIGAIIVFLFVLALFIVDGKMKWWLFASAIFGIILSWGGNFKLVTDFFIDYVPLYNKFRTLSMALVITSFAAVLMALLAIKAIIEKPEILKIKKTQFFISFGLVAGICFLVFIAPSAFSDFLSAREVAQFEADKANPQSAAQVGLYVDGLVSARTKMVKADAIRSFAFILLAAALLFIYSKTSKGFKSQYLVISLIVLILADMWTIDRRYLNNDMFVKKRVAKQPFKTTPADDWIHKDVDPNFRVLNFLHKPFQDAFTPYHHKSIGGYHGAKLRRYQEVIEEQLGKEMQNLYAAKFDTILGIDPVLERSNIVNMMNTKYIIYGPEYYNVKINMKALGHAWFVEEYEIVENADEEIAALDRFNPAKKAIIDERFVDKVKLPKADFFSLDSTSYIKLESYKPNHLVYKAGAKKERLAVFSEIYYDKGWNAYIDGFLTPHIRVNYILRGLVVPKGPHTIEFKFEPKTYNISQTVAMGSSIFVVLLLLGGIAYAIKNRKPQITEEEKKK